jgi:peptidoglycan hydrolase-like protein with peptidoglycan-binding domain
MLLKKGSQGADVKKVQTFLKISADGIFGSGTEAAVKNWQAANGLSADGIVGDKTWAKMGLGASSATAATAAATTAKTGASGFDETYKDVVIDGSTFPGKPYSSDVKVLLNTEMTKEYIPTMKQVLPNGPKGLHLLITVMAHHEGFKAGTRSYRTNNPGNIGNTDSGANKSIATLGDGILLQRNYLNDIVTGKSKAYPMNQAVFIKPYYSPEIAKNSKTYGMSPWLPGYKFTFTGQLDQFVKIYSTGARAGNSYINTIVSYFKANGIAIQPSSKIQDIIAMN